VLAQAVQRLQKTIVQIGFALIKLTMRTPDQILGPYFPLGSLPTQTSDLTAIFGPERRPAGDVIEVIGRVLNIEGSPVRGAKLTLWHANSFGRYTHPGDLNPAPLDANFVGFAELSTDQEGAYRIKTIKPGAYPASDWMRPPHIHFEVHGKFDRLITQMYFPNEPLNADDRFLNSVSQPDQLIAQPLGHGLGRILKFDIILSRG
jgi:protocatechuate 3,4-dioxygenase, beta subunit